MRYEIDEMRDNATINVVGSGQSSAANSISKSLGAELAGKMKWDEDEETVDAETSSDTLLEEEESTEGEEEDVIQTIITRKKRVSFVSIYLFSSPRSPTLPRTESRQSRCHRSSPTTRL
jgi:hypothetical protein